MEIKKEDKFLVLKRDDIKDYTNDEQKEWIERSCHAIRSHRLARGKKDNTYLVVNEDELYAKVVWKLIEISQANPEGLLILLENLEVELLGYD